MEIAERIFLLFIIVSTISSIAFAFNHYMEKYFYALAYQKEKENENISFRKEIDDGKYMVVHKTPTITGYRLVLRNKETLEIRKINVYKYEYESNFIGFPVVLGKKIEDSRRKSVEF